MSAVEAVSLAEVRAACTGVAHAIINGRNGLLVVRLTQANRRMSTELKRREAFEAAVIERMKEGGFLEVEIRVECLQRNGDGYADGSVDAYWHFWNAALTRLAGEISALNLSTRAENCLRMLGIETIDELCKVTEPELKGGSNLGKKTLTEIKDALASHGLSLASAPMQQS